MVLFSVVFTDQDGVESAQQVRIIEEIDEADGKAIVVGNNAVLAVIIVGCLFVFIIVALMAAILCICLRIRRR